MNIAAQIKEKQQAIDTLTAERDALIEQKGKVWVPNENELVFFVGVWGGASEMTYRGQLHSSFYLRGNVFRTKEEAEAADARNLATQRVLRRVAELGGGEFVVGKDNYCPYWCHDIAGFRIESTIASQYIPEPRLYAGTGVWEQVRAEMLDDVRTVWGVA